VTDEFRTSIRITATPDEVFPYLVDPDQLVRWMGESAIIDARAGGRYDLVVAGYGISGHIEVYDPPKRLVMTWGFIDNPDLPPAASTVEVILTPAGTPVGAETILELTHRGLTPDQQESHRIGWLHWLERLRVRASGGDPGPDVPPVPPAPAPSDDTGGR
jgi:uncharacterized protein YndB with AHSA1/START domain